MASTPFTLPFGDLAGFAAEGMEVATNNIEAAVMTRLITASEEDVKSWLESINDLTQETVDAFAKVQEDYDPSDFHEDDLGVVQMVQNTLRLMQTVAAYPDVNFNDIAKAADGICSMVIDHHEWKTENTDAIEDLMEADKVRRGLYAKIVSRVIPDFPEPEVDSNPFAALLQSLEPEA